MILDVLRLSLLLWLAPAAFSDRVIAKDPAESDAPTPPDGIALEDFEASARGFPSVRDLRGGRLADGDFYQWLEGDRLHVKITYAFIAGRRVEEQAVFTEKPGLVQEQWLWQEFKGGSVSRRFSVNFGAKKATALKQTDSWSEDLDIKPGRTFAGFGFALALKGLEKQLMKGEKAELEAVAFTPKPRTIPVEITSSGLEQMLMGGRTIQGQGFVIHPKVPAIARLFVRAPDNRLWLTSDRPAGFLRLEGPMAEPSDPIIRVDLLPGETSGPAMPVLHAIQPTKPE